MKQELRRQLEGDEDKRSTVYLDSKGYATIGIGRLIDGRVPGAGLREDEITYLFNNDINDRINQLTHRLPWFHLLDDVRKGVLINMSFQMGVDGLLEFKKTLEFVRRGKYAEASAEMMKSKWATEDSPNRARRMARQMRTGVWQYTPGT